jgi:hypothetical protein
MGVKNNNKDSTASINTASSEQAGHSGLDVRITLLIN